MPGLVLPFSGPASNFMVSCRGFVDVLSSSVPSYTAPMPVLVKRLPSITMRALSRPADISWPSISRAVTVHGPCSRSISCAIVGLRQDYSWVAAPNAGDVMTNVMVVERFFRDLTEDVVREGSFTSVEELVTAMMAYLGERNL